MGTLATAPLKFLDFRGVVAAFCGYWGDFSCAFFVDPHSDPHVKICGKVQREQKSNRERIALQPYPSYTTCAMKPPILSAASLFISFVTLAVLFFLPCQENPDDCTDKNNRRRSDKQPFK